MKKVYICGPMTGYENWNRDAFFAKERELAEKGYRVLNPARVGDEGLSWEQNMRLALSLLLEADAICPLDGWEDSRGAQVEMALAKELDMEVIV